MGLVNQKNASDKSSLVNCKTDIQQLKKGEVALLKGESWNGNQGSGLIHRYIKPPNILISTDVLGEERVQILDFGMSGFGRSLGFGRH